MISKYNFEEVVEYLSDKYRIQYSKVYDKMTIMEIKLIIREPFKYIFKYDKHRNDAFKIVDRYYRIKSKWYYTRKRLRVE
jgi:hypothetical protein